MSEDYEVFFNVNMSKIISEETFYLEENSE